MIILGMLLGTIGTDTHSGAFRFTMGIVELRDSLSIVAVALGIFGVVEVFRNLENAQREDPGNRQDHEPDAEPGGLRRSIGPILRGTFLGSISACCRAAGSILSAFTSYAVEKRISKHPERFGNGAIEGVAGPESANNAGAQTSFIPLLTLGIPSHALMALMIGAMMIQGITPGPRVVIEQPELFWGVIASMWIGNAMLIILNLPLVGMWVAMLRIPTRSCFPRSWPSRQSASSPSRTKRSISMFWRCSDLLGYGLTSWIANPAPFHARLRARRSSGRAFPAVARLLQRRSDDLLQAPDLARPSDPGCGNRGSDAAAVDYQEARRDLRRRRLTRTTRQTNKKAGVMHRPFSFGVNASRAVETGYSRSRRSETDQHVRVGIGTFTARAISCVATNCASISMLRPASRSCKIDGRCGTGDAPSPGRRNPIAHRSHRLSQASPSSSRAARQIGRRSALDAPAPPWRWSRGLTEATSAPDGDA